MSAGNVLDPKDSNLRRMLYKLAKTDCQANNAESVKLHKDAVALFEAIYSDGNFRHSYSNIFGIVSAIHDDARLGDISVLQNNLTLLIDESQIKANGIDKQLRKLYDHISLDASRIDYFVTGYIKSLRKEIKTSKENYKTLEGKIIEASNKIEDTQKNSIAILSIFAAVILSCAGGFSFTSSVLSNIHKASAYKIVFAMIAAALVVINILHALFGYLGGIISSQKINFSWRNSANKILCSLLIILGLCWYFGAVELRNAMILGK